MLLLCAFKFSALVNYYKLNLNFHLVLSQCNFDFESTWNSKSFHVRKKLREIIFYKLSIYFKLPTRETQNTLNPMYQVWLLHFYLLLQLVTETLFRSFAVILLHFTISFLYSTSLENRSRPFYHIVTINVL